MPNPLAEASAELQAWITHLETVHQEKHKEREQAEAAEERAADQLRHARTALQFLSVFVADVGPDLRPSTSSSSESSHSSSVPPVPPATEDHLW